MNKKGSMELSVNSIVILVIAVVMMGLILGFIRTKFSSFNGEFTVDEQAAAEATPSNPITLSRDIVTLNGVKKVGLNVKVYNSINARLNNTFPVFECNGVDGPVIYGQYFAKNISTNTMVEFTGNIRLSSAKSKDTYLCMLCIYTDLPAGQTHETRCSTLAPSRYTLAKKEFKIVVQ
jgi:hypothetical protein